MQYSREFISEHEVPRARKPILQHIVDTYASETNKVGAVWSELRNEHLDFRLHPRSGSIRQILTHQILSESRFFSEFIGLAEPPPEALLPAGDSPAVQSYIDRVISLARARLAPIAAGDDQFWLTEVSFFDVRRQRIWVFWRRLLHTAHHRAQVGDCLRMLHARVPPTYGPTADVTWWGAEPTETLDAVRRAQR